MDYFLSTVIKNSFSLYIMLIDGLWIIVMFLSAVWTLILMAHIHCRGFIGEQINFSESVPIKKKTSPSWMA